MGRRNSADRNKGVNNNMLQILYDARVFNPRTRHWGPGVVIQEILSRLNDRYVFIGVSYSFKDAQEYNLRSWPRIPKLNSFLFEFSPLLCGEWDVFWGTNHFLPTCVFRKPSVLTVYDLLLFRYPADQRYTRLFAWRFMSSLKRATKIICASRTTADDLLRLFPWLSSKFIVIRLGVDPDRLRGEAQQAMKRRFYDGPYVVVPGAHRPRKNLPLAVAAIKAAKELGLSRLRLYVTGSIHDNFRALINETDVHATGTLARQEYLALIRGAVALLFPSIYEGFGLPILEAMAMECPVLGLNTHINGEIAGDAGILLPNDPFEWARNLDRLVKDRKWREEIIAKGLENIEKFKWERTVQEYEEVFREVVR